MKRDPQGLRPRWFAGLLPHSPHVTSAWVTCAWIGVASCQGARPTAPTPEPPGATGLQEAAADASAPLELPFNQDPEITSVWSYLSARYDSNADGLIQQSEYTRDNWLQLDLDENGVLTPEEMAKRTMMPSGAVRRRLLLASHVGRYLQADEDPGLLTRPELHLAIAALDANSDGKIDEHEFEQRSEERAQLGSEFGVLTLRSMGQASAWQILSQADSDADGQLATAELDALFDQLEAEDPVSPRRADGKLHLKRPARAQVGQLAPDFTLLPPLSSSALAGSALASSSGQPFTLSELRGVRPVALIFGSYT